VSEQHSAENDAQVERIDRYTIEVDGRPVLATEDQEERIRALDAEARARFLAIMGHPIPPGSTAGVDGG
jgi:hypothetical protein